MTSQFDMNKLCEFYVERLRVYARENLGLYPEMLKSIGVEDMAWSIDKQAYRSIMVLANMAKGETVMEDKAITNEYTFRVFATWVDHLKYNIQQRRILKFLPIRWTRKLRIRYQDVVKKQEWRAPVSILRACPHALVNFTDRPGVHLAFMFPSRKDEIQ